eukprot:CAMPEP_0181238324 /NCGR_PEP_ID=MMETSP1096-20121128/39274_1 /TAXON_ID=156174 ORGANISM="Chrysochromulina ericina, Strain CCMP281" /NCGR_SAMPLE_ID=MMETSP1096 /ASSEMBLY_ACC=CAM_ASM_000453 /LENGTH=56 /DNA_ID=CAMNT_0023333815 /DNA_START=336 /DNA_END=506 /DNA_ORIENTATION=-
MGERNTALGRSATTPTRTMHGMAVRPRAVFASGEGGGGGRSVCFLWEAAWQQRKDS